MELLDARLKQTVESLTALHVGYQGIIVVVMHG